MQSAELFKDEGFRDLLRAITTSSVGWEDLLDMTLPRGFTPNEAWEMIHEVNAGVGEQIPTPMDDARMFFRYSLELVGNIIGAYRTIAELSALMPYDEYAYHERIARKRASDFAAGAILDGYDVDVDHAAKVALGEASAVSVGERLVANAFAATDSSAGSAVDPDTFLAYREVVLENIDVREIRDVRLPVRLPLAPERYVRAQAGDQHPVAVRYFDYLRDELGQSTDFAFSRFLVTPDYLRTFTPDFEMPSIASTLVLGNAARQLGMPAAGLLSFSAQRLAWERGEYEEGMYPYSRADVDASMRREERLGLYDVTMLQVVLARMWLVEAQRLLGFVRELRSRQEAIAAALHASSRFNLRQRSILARAAKGADRTFTIRYHEANHDISYSTARRDFQELVDDGFLDVRMDGKTQLFFAGPRFDERMADRFGVEP